MGYRDIVITLVVSVVLIGAFGLFVAYKNGAFRGTGADAVTEHEFPRALDEQSNAATTQNNTIETSMETHARTATIKTNKGDIVLELYTEDMPITTGNFITLAEDDFYDGTKFHRVVRDFIIQAGDPLSKEDDSSVYGTGGPGYTIPDEHVAGEHLSNVRGTVAMANAGPESGGSQFFINVKDNVGLDYDKQPLTSQHPVFGKVIKGMDVVDAINRVPTNERGVPVDPIVVSDIAVE